MRDMIMVTDASKHAALHRSSFTVDMTPLSLTPLQELESRNKLVHALQTSLEPDEILAIFFHHLQVFVKLGGIRFTFPDGRTARKLGRVGLHHCDYRLNIETEYLGDISFSRSKRFAESELALVELLLGSLVYPLRNALRYQTAMQLALQDPLTGLGNRTALDKALQRELQLAERHQQTLSLLMIDIDHFKKINDQHGHSRGDQVLRKVSETIQMVSRESDITFRYGGEEFVVLLQNTDAHGALVIAERIRRQIAKLNIGVGISAISPTVSVGIGSHSPNIKEHIDDLFERADKALYSAKANGRNCVMNIHTAG